VYAGTPTFAYIIGSYAVERNGALTFPNNIFHRESTDLIMALRERGYEVETNGLPDSYALQATEHEEAYLGVQHDCTCENRTNDSTALNCDENPIIDPHQSTQPVVSTDGNNLVVEVPRTHISLAAIESIKKIVASKETLIKKALCADSLPIDITPDKLCFPWFSLTGTDGEADTYTKFVYAICEMAKRQRRITAKEQEVTNNKFAFRIFLIRLGFVGTEFKVARKILLRNLTGNSSWKGGQPPTPTEEGAHYGKEQ